MTAVFTELIRPKLTQVTLAEMIDATGLSRPYCAMIRRGERVPHARHWQVLGLSSANPQAHSDELARQSGVSERMLRYLRDGARRPSPAVTPAILGALGEMLDD